MAKDVDIQYGVTFGKCDSSDWIPWSIELDDDEEAAYDRAILLRIPLDSVDKLTTVLDAVAEEIADEEINNLLEFEDEYVQECRGVLPVDPDEINDLIANRDEHAMRFFGLTELSDEELDEWDANDLDELPLVCDFVENFEPENPFDAGYTLNIEFCEHPEEEDFDREIAEKAIRLLFSEADGDYSELDDYIDRCSDLFDDDMDLTDLVQEIAEELEIEDYPE